MRQELLDKLPRNWSEVTLNQYVAFVKGCKKAIKGKTDKQVPSTIVALFFYQFVGQNIVDAQLTDWEIKAVIDRLNQFREDKPKIEIDATMIKSFDKISYEEYITFTKLQTKGLDSYPQLINMLLLEPITDIGNTMDMATVNSFFLLVQEQLIKYLQRSQTYLEGKLTPQQKQEVQERLHGITNI